ncbi:FAD-dependent oxidoreductase [Granulicella cerasi]|uniref:FAD-dependent oxidoreductase n=1 Tax=Granulicella cerasi TaxID=741063 RepID=A0ABW1ZE71_9BACT|nr:FAD-dependent oxidoreductase [Granulicella cerasi]
MRHPISTRQPVVIVGAGPFGLSLAAHLAEARVPFRIFGRPMQTWKTQMPVDMHLKSDGFASNLYAGRARSFTLEDFCTERGLPYHPTAMAIPLATFIAYGEEFARRIVPTLEPQNVTALDTNPDGSFALTLEDGERFTASAVVLATGLSVNHHLPTAFAALAPQYVSHTAEHQRFDRFTGQRVAVLGRGASSLNAAALLHQAGAHVTLITRKRNIFVHGPSDGSPRSWRARLRHPGSPLGPSWRSWASSRLPLLFHALPAPLRHAVNYKHLGPAGGVALHGLVFDRFPILRQTEILTASATDDHRLALTLRNLVDGAQQTLLVDHLIAGTGFRQDLARLRFLAPELRSRIRTHANGSPRLDRRFQTSIAALYVIGPAAADSFSPLFKFAAGADFAARHLTAHLQRQT